MGAFDLEPWMVKSGLLPQDQPCFVVDLAAWPAELSLDSCTMAPLIGVGKADHPFAQQCDLLIEAPFALESVVRAIVAQPFPAAAFCQLLRATAQMTVHDAIMMESLTYAALQASNDHLQWRRKHQPGVVASAGAIDVERDGDCLIVTMNRPDERNAIDRHMRDALREAFELVRLDHSIGKVELCGAGRFFSVGADLREFGTTLDPLTAHAIRMRTLPCIPMARRAEIFNVHINGGAVGSGLELAAFAGRVTCSSESWFQLPEMSMGILPGAGGCVSIPRRIGRQRTALLVLSGKRINAETALRWGLVDAIC